MPLSRDPSSHLLNIVSSPIQPFFLPNSIAVVGAKDDLNSVGRTLMMNLNAHFKGKIYPINPKRSDVLGHTCYPDLASVNAPIDLVLIATPAKSVPALMQQCNDLRIPAAIVISAGFKELGPEGLKLEQDLLAKKGATKLIGPNCLGVMNPIHGLNATFASKMALPGNIAFISQSGAMCTAVLDWSLQEKIGFSAFVSVGSMADVQWGDLIDYLGRDPNTESILIYMETIGNARAFLSAAKEVALTKPIIVIKPGRTAQAAQAAASHTGSLAGSDEVFDAAMQRVGVLRVDSIAELFHMAQVLAKQPKPQGPKLAIITNAGGPAVLATDAAIRQGAEMASLENDTIDRLNRELPAAWSHANPVDILGDAPAYRYAIACQEMLNAKDVDGVLVILTPQDMTDPTETAKSLLNLKHTLEKPIITSWMGGDSVIDGATLLSQSGIPVFAYPDDAAASFAKMWQYSKQLKALYETPPTFSENESQEYASIRRLQAQELFNTVLSENRTLLTESESKQLLQLYRIPTVVTKVGKTLDEALSIAKEIGYPLVLKLHSLTITHKSDIGGVKLNLKNEKDVQDAYQAIQQAANEHFNGVTVQKMVQFNGAYELIIGCSEDPQFGPVLLFGAGGKLVEVLKDSALALPPINGIQARSLIAKTNISHALNGVRGEKPIDSQALESLLVTFSQMIAELPRIKECDINPLLASSEGLIALDARVVLHEYSIKDNELPKTALRPYSVEYIKQFKLENQQLIMRPIRSEDEPLMREFHQSLSEKTVQSRYLKPFALQDRVTHDYLLRLCFSDFDREISLVIQNFKKQIIGFGRLAIIPGTKNSELTMIVIDSQQNQGIGTLLIEHLLFIAKKEGLIQISAHIGVQNTHMINLCKKMGFEITETSEQITTAELVL
ncbi:MAG: bifunctional acetate--CoA ligase family protein/GNAT family N-acetyltransferase [Parachlamydiales bacterium]|nr:bifunctional acetate--CoA ligase family protein/GNAT family N-acetyltransferase [Parachlamydiales bacterium]